MQAGHEGKHSLRRGSSFHRVLKARVTESKTKEVQWAPHKSEPYEISVFSEGLGFNGEVGQNVFLCFKKNDSDAH